MDVAVLSWPLRCRTQRDDLGIVPYSWETNRFSVGADGIAAYVFLAAPVSYPAGRSGDRPLQWGNEPFFRRGRCPHRPGGRRYSRVRLFWPFRCRTRRDDLGLVPYSGETNRFSVGADAHIGPGADGIATYVFPGRSGVVPSGTIWGSSPANAKNIKEAHIPC